MKFRSITFKWFFIISMFFIAFLSITTIMQSVFFEKYYITTKTKKLENEVQKFKIKYIDSKRNIEAIYNDLMEFQNSNNAQVAIMNNNNMIFYSIISNSQTDKKYTTKDQVLYNAIMKWNIISKNNNTIDKANTIVYNIKDNSFNTSNIVCIVPVIEGGTIQDVIFVTSSLQPVGEAVSAMKDFNLYLFSGALIFIILLSLIYSNMVSKPLVNLNKNAIKMANLDFSTKCEIKSRDEIGSLAQSLNILSTKLSKTLEELTMANKKLKADIDRERDMEKMRKEFVAGVSHELKTPISLIEGYAEGLKDNIANTDERDFYIDVIIDEANKMSELVSDMLDLSQLDTGHYKLNKKAFYINNLIAYTVKRFSNSIQKNNIDLRINFENNDCEVLADEFRIEQVITNILSNAIRHTVNNGIIDIRIKNNSNDKVLIQIENQGYRINEEDIDKIWDKFYKVDKSRSRESGGTGLGLAIVKNILILHKSEFGVKNTEVGVLFYFTLDKKI